jgi:hypothetical protein
MAIIEKSELQAKERQSKEIISMERLSIDLPTKGWNYKKFTSVLLTGQRGIFLNVHFSVLI